MPFVLMYWKEILVGILIVSLLTAGYWLRGVIADNDAMKITISEKYKEIDGLVKTNEALVKSISSKTEELQSYINLVKRLNADKLRIQNNFESYMEKIKNEKPKTVPGIGITEPYVLVGPGVPTYSRYSSGSYHP